MRHFVHLVARFVRSLTASRPGIADQALVAHHLRAPEATVFWRQPVPDLDHALRGARHVLTGAPDRTDLVRAFLLHDIGKRHARLGTLGRSIVTALAMLRLPVGGRGRRYLDHAEIGARELADLGAPPLVVGFARHHHHQAPTGIDPADWGLLVAADHR